MKINKKLIFTGIAILILSVGAVFGFRWYKSHNAIKYAIARGIIVAITGNDYETTIKKLHNLPLVDALENDGEITLLQDNDILKLEITHSPIFKNLIKNKRHILSFRAGAKSQLQSLLAVEVSRDAYDSLMQQFFDEGYSKSNYNSPSGEIIEVYNSSKQKELVVSYALGVMVLTNEALFAEETLKNIRSHSGVFVQADLNFNSNSLYVKQENLRQWVDNFTTNHTSEFYQWFENIDECEAKLNDEGSLADMRFYYSKNANTFKSSKVMSSFNLEAWLQNITPNFIAFHPDTANSEVKLKELYRCYSNMQDENISANTFIIGYSIIDSSTLLSVFSKHSLEQSYVLSNHKVFKFGKYPFFRNFCNGATPDLPESYISLIAPNMFVVTSSVSTMIPLLQKMDAYPPELKESNPAIFVMQIQPGYLIPYYSRIVREPYRERILHSTFIQNLDFVQLRFDSLGQRSGVGTLLFSKNATTNASTSELIWSKTLEQETQEITLLQNVKSNSKFMFYQDEKNVLHCLDFGAREVWQKFILGKIQSKISAIDLYRDGSTQYIFNTPNQIYALNDKGNDMSNFPKQINTEGIAGMYLFDMGDAYEYFMVQGRLLYGFAAAGASLEDWRPRESPVNIDFELLHFKKRNKNYIVGISHTGEVILWNRFGKRVERDIDFKNKINTNFYITSELNKKYHPELISVDTSGLIFSFTLDSLKRKEYKKRLISNATGHFIVQTNDSNFQKIIYQHKDKLLFFDRYTQRTDSISMTKNYELQNVFDINEKHTFIVISDGITSKVMASTRKIVADKIEGNIIGIMADEIPNRYFIITFDALKRVNLYKFSM